MAGSCGPLAEKSECNLATLPTELLLIIAKYNADDFQATSSLYNTSTRFRRLLGQHAYQSRSCFAFRRSVAKRDLDAIRRCKQFDAAPANIVLGSERGDELVKGFQYSKPFAGAHLMPLETPLGLLLTSFRYEKDSAETVLETMDWLLANGADPSQYFLYGYTDLKYKDPTLPPSWYQQRSTGSAPVSFLIRACKRLDDLTNEKLIQLVWRLFNHGAHLHFDTDFMVDIHETIADEDDADWIRSSQAGGPARLRLIDGSGEDGPSEDPCFAMRVDMPPTVLDLVLDNTARWGLPLFHIGHGIFFYGLWPRLMYIWKKIFDLDYRVSLRTRWFKEKLLILIKRDVLHKRDIVFIEEMIDKLDRVLDRCTRPFHSEKDKEELNFIVNGPPPPRSQTPNLFEEELCDRLLGSGTVE